jgi:hypothetical protein
LAQTLLNNLHHLEINWYNLGVTERKGVVIMGEQNSILEEKKCIQAVGVIRDLISRECQGFILPPSEVRRLLGIPGHYQTWYLHRNVHELRKKLANNYISVAVSPEQGISFTLYKVPREESIRVSPIN